jgi:hypothetical protein
MIVYGNSKHGFSRQNVRVNPPVIELARSEDWRGEGGLRGGQLLGTCSKGGGS